MNKLTPADQLKQLLLAGNGPDTEQVQAFFKLHKVEIENVVEDYIMNYFFFALVEMFEIHE